MGPGLAPVPKGHRGGSWNEVWRPGPLPILKTFPTHESLTALMDGTQSMWENTVESLKELFKLHKKSDIQLWQQLGIPSSIDTADGIYLK